MKRELKTRLLPATLLFLCPCKMAATEVGDSVDTYQNQTVSTYVKVQGRTVLSSSNVTVTPTGKLKMSAPQRIDISGPFTVELGGTLELNGGNQWPVRYIYDSSVNILKREKY